MVNYGFDPEWKQWIWTNIANGVSKQVIFDQLIKNGYARSSIIAELDFIPDTDSTSVKNQDNQGQMISNFYQISHIARAVHSLGGRRLSKHFPIFVIPDFVSASCCGFFIDWIKEKSCQSTVVDENPISQGRVSQTCHFMDMQDVEVRDMRLKFAGLLGVPINHMEAMQGQWYKQGGFYNPHFDAFDPRNEDLYKKHTALGGQRTWTCMVNLNQSFSGGYTNFPELDLEIKPLSGQAILWDNVDKAFRPHQQSLHGGMPVDEGDKFILTQWFRQFVRG